MSPTPEDTLRPVDDDNRGGLWPELVIPPALEEFVVLLKETKLDWDKLTEAVIANSSRGELKNWGIWPYLFGRAHLQKILQKVSDTGPFGRQNIETSNFSFSRLPNLPNVVVSVRQAPQERAHAGDVRENYDSLYRMNRHPVIVDLVLTHKMTKRGDDRSHRGGIHTKMLPDSVRYKTGPVEELGREYSNFIMLPPAYCIIVYPEMYDSRDPIQRDFTDHGGVIARFPLTQSQFKSGIYHQAERLSSL